MRPSFPSDFHVTPFSLRLFYLGIWDRFSIKTRRFFCTSQIKASFSLSLDANLWTSCLLKPKQVDDLNGMPLCQKYKHIHALSKKNTLMEPTFILKSLPDVFAEPSNLKLELLLLYLYFSQKPDSDWLVDLLVRRGKKKKKKDRKRQPKLQHQTLFNSVCMYWFALSRAEGLELAACFQPAGAAACATWHLNNSLENRTPFLRVSGSYTLTSSQK